MYSRINKELIRNFLTVRYDPKSKPLATPAKWRDFRVTSSDPRSITSERLLHKSIEKKLPGTDTVTISLSSGIDSTLCLALVRKYFPKRKIVAICAVFKEGFDESKRAHMIAKKFDAEFRVVYVDSIFTRMPELVAIVKKPRWNTYHHIVAREAKKFGNYLVTGDGADELFGGYTFRYNKFINLLRRNDTWKTKVINYLECHNRDWVADQKELFGSSIRFDWSIIHNYFKPYFSNSLEPLQQVMLADYNGKLLYDFIPSGKSISEHYQIHGAPIFLDEELTRFVLSLPLSQKYDSKSQRGKIILRNMAKRLGVDHIEEKRGFSPDLLLDWNSHGRKVCESYIMEKDSCIFKKKLINYNWVLRAFERIEDDGDVRYLNRLISILALEIWYRIFISKDMNSQMKLKY
ncbi:MAG: asparagine synthase C-terminal domain-containing protein [Nitrosotalea sp.]